MIIGATLLVSAISLVGIVAFSLKEELLKSLVLFMVALSAGALIGGAFLHLMPEAIKLYDAETVFGGVLIGFVLFFIVEKVFHWRHCHKEHCEVHTFAYMNLFGDIIHNFIDGLIIAASFVTNAALGLSTTLAVALHEIPQEIGDFGVLIYGGFKKKKAIMLNFVTALSAVVGGVIGYYLVSYIQLAQALLLPIAAGGFMYIAASDLIPEIRKEAELKKSIATFVMFLVGIAIMYFSKSLG